jgi:hypothetical protein
MPDPIVLAKWLAEEEEHLHRLQAQRDRLLAEIARAEQKAALIKNLIALQASPTAVQQTVLPRGRFKEVSVRDATLTVLREQRRANLDKIVDALISGGLDFDHRRPKRVVFITLTNLIRGKDEAPIRKEQDEFVYVEKEAEKEG